MSTAPQGNAPANVSALGPAAASPPSAAGKLPRVLMVDDEPLALSGFRRTLARSFDLTVAEGGAAGLAAIAAGPEFAVIVTDMRMPVMDGIGFITAARAVVKARNASYMMLTGNADQQTATDAVNRGHIFRFLNKPCETEALSAALAAGVRQHELVVAERVLLQDTVTGSIRVLTDALEMVNPGLFQYQADVKLLMAEVCGALGLERDWQLSLAASLCLIGLVAVGGRSDAGPGSLDEATLAEVAAIGGRLLRHIPRLAPIAGMIRRQREPGWLPIALAALVPRPDAEQVGAQLLRYCVDLAREKRGNGPGGDGVSLPRSVAIDRLSTSGLYDPRLTTALTKGRGAAAIAAAAVRFVRRAIPVAELAEGMVPENDVLTTDGALLLPAGLPVSELAAARLRNLARTGRAGPTVTIREELDPLVVAA
jgi:CheY-like chemotaxis protein